MDEQRKVSTNDYPAGRFKAHGQTSYRFEGEILYIETSGPYNAEIMQASQLAFDDLLGNSPHPARRAEIAIVTHDIQMTPEALQAFRALLARMAREGKLPVATAMVAGPEVEGIRFMSKLLAAAYAEARLPFRHFEHIEGARSWVREQLAKH